eukprot:SAG11_NODE_21007_length_434_cov_0.761194_1_plen_39_part_01
MNIGKHSYLGTIDRILVSGTKTENMYMTKVHPYQGMSSL